MYSRLGIYVETGSIPGDTMCRNVTGTGQSPSTLVFPVSLLYSLIQLPPTLCCFVGESVVK